MNEANNPGTPVHILNVSPSKLANMIVERHVAPGGTVPECGTYLNGDVRVFQTETAAYMALLRDMEAAVMIVKGRLSRIAEARESDPEIETIVG